jgi:Zn-dependent M28 family amino/carboxypeptidase
MKNTSRYFLFISLFFTFPIGFCFPAPSITISRDSLSKHVYSLSSIQPPRNARRIASLEKAAAYIESTLVGTGNSFREQPFTVGNFQYKNIISCVGKGTKKTLVIGAHYDVSGNQSGADDNASGVAGLLELSRVLKQNESLLDREIMLVFYTLEEPPFFGTKYMGSYVHAKSLADEKRKIECMISLEMIGYFKDEKKSQTYPIGLLKLFYPDQGNFIAAVGDYHSGKYVKKIARSINKNSNVPCHYIIAPGIIPALSFSDHRNYKKFHFPALMITDTADFRNPNYHNERDVPGTLDYVRMSEVVKGVAVFILSLS